MNTTTSRELHTTSTRIDETPENFDSSYGILLSASSGVDLQPTVAEDHAQIMPTAPMEEEQILSLLHKTDSPAIAAFSGDQFCYGISGMKRWEGTVIEVCSELITAELKSLDDGGSILIADFRKVLLGPDDSRTVAIGDVVYVAVRTVRGESGGPTVTSAIRLRRLGHWTAEEVEAISARADERRKVLIEYVD